MNTGVPVFYSRSRDSSAASFKPQTDLLPPSFFIIDEACRDERVPVDDIVLFFYPPTVPQETQLKLVGLCSAVEGFVSSVVSSPDLSSSITPQTLSLARTRIVLCPGGVKGVMQVLVGPLEVTESVLQSLMQILSTALRFFTGPFAHLYQRCDGNRQELQRRIRHGCKELIPILRAFHDGKLAYIQPIPYLELSYESGPLFVEASQLLTSLERREEALQGCFLYENSVLCSHLDVDMTRWILCRTEHLRGVLPPRSVHQSAVFVLTEQAERMQRVKSQYTEGHVHPSPLADTQPVKITSLPSAGGDYLGLLVVLMEKLTIGLVITFDTLVNEAYGSNLMKAERSRFDLLEHRLSVVLAEEPPMPHAPSGSAWLEVPITQGGGGIRNHAELGYRILRLDSFTRRGVGNGTEDRHDEAEQTFLRSVRYAREMFANDSDVSQVVLRDYPGTLYARRVLGQETYFRPLLKAVGKHGKFVAVNTELEGIERRAANSLLHHHELHLL